MKLLLKWVICAAAFAAAAALFPGQVSGGAWQFAIAGMVLWAANLLVRPLLHILCLPATMLTFGLFYFVINTWMVGLTDALLPFLSVGGFFTRLLIALLVSAGNAVLIGSRRKRGVS